MKKKLFLGLLLVLLLLYAPTYKLNLKSDDSGQASSPTQDAAPAPPPLQDGQYKLSLTTSIGTLTYYNQSDVRWANAPYGASDPIASYGCGPTALAMLVSSFTEQTMQPPDMAQWAASNHYWVSGSGSKHNLIPEGAAAFGLHAESFRDFTVEGIKNALESGHVLVALMGPGHFTSEGHFIIITDYWSGSQVSIADPNSLENTQKAWDIQLLIDELHSAAVYGGPVWSISP